MTPHPLRQPKRQAAHATTPKQRRSLVRVTGSCHCGQITYEAEIDPERASLCNCTDCQVLSGAPFRVSVHAPAPTFRLLTGSPKTYVKTGDSGGRRRNSFCANCGSPIAACADSDTPPTYSLRVGCLAQKAALPPKRRIWCRSALPWALNVGEVPGIEGQ